MTDRTEAFRAADLTAATARAEAAEARADLAEALLAILYRAADDAVWNMPDWRIHLRAAVVKVNVRGNVTREDAIAAYEYLAENRKEQGNE